MSGLSEERKGYLETTIREALADGAKVVIWITPMHPREAQHMAEKTRYRDLVRMTSDYLRELSARYGIAAYDFSDPATFGGTLTGWYDGAHADPSNGARIIERVLGKA
jgi:hypothetical protein